MGNDGEHASVGGSNEFDRMVDALSHRDRRRVLAALRERNPIDSQTVMAGRGGQRPAEDEPRLVHHHLPKLDDLEYVSWDRASGTIMKGPKWDEIEPLLTVLGDNRERLPGDVF